jgi:transcription elongation factor Elf1
MTHMATTFETFERFLCPHCGAANALSVDLTAGADQRFVVDCEVCCAPIAVRVAVHDGDIAAIDVRKENE